MAQLKVTPFNQFHILAKAKMVDYAGFHMPISYVGLRAEHMAVREKAGLFDVSHMGTILVEGNEALDLIQHVCSNDASKLKKGKVQYSCLLNKKGGIVDDLLVYCLDKNRYMLVVNAANINKDYQWINKQNNFDTHVADFSDHWSLLALQGPESVDILNKLCDIDVSKIKYYTFKRAKIAGVKDVIVSATGYTGEKGFELYFEREHGHKIWKVIANTGVQKCGLASRDTLRLEMGYALYGNDIDDTVTPLEAGLGWITSFKKGDFIAKTALEKQKKSGPKKKLTGFELLERGIARKGYPILNEKGKQIGEITSGTMSVCMDKAIAMGYVESAYAKGEKPVFVEIREKPVPMKKVALPFYKKEAVGS